MVRFSFRRHNRGAALDKQIFLSHICTGKINLWYKHKVCPMLMFFKVFQKTNCIEILCFAEYNAHLFSRILFCKKGLHIIYHYRFLILIFMPHFYKDDFIRPEYYLTHRYCLVYRYAFSRCSQVLGPITYLKAKLNLLKIIAECKIVENMIVTVCN